MDSIELRKALTRVEKTIKEIQRKQPEGTPVNTGTKTLKKLQFFKENLQGKLNRLLLEDNVVISMKNGATKVANLSPEDTQLLRTDSNVTDLQTTTGKKLKEGEDRGNLENTVLAKKVAKSVLKVLRIKGDEISDGKIRNITDRGFSVMVMYKPTVEGLPLQDDVFKFTVEASKLYLELEEKHNMADIFEESGIRTVEAAVFEDRFKAVLNSRVSGVPTEGEQLTEEGSLKEEFRDAVREWKRGRSEKLLRAASKYSRGVFIPGFREATNSYCKYGEPVITGPESVEGENLSEEAIDRVVMSVPLFLRALEFAKEDAQEDVDLHTFTENVLKLLSTKEKLTMDDYSQLVPTGGKVGADRQSDEDLTYGGNL